MHRTYELMPIRTRGDVRPAAGDVRVKLIVALAAILAVVAAKEPWLPLAAVAAALLMLRMWGVGPRYLLHRLVGPAGLAAAIGLLPHVHDRQHPAVCLPRARLASDSHAGGLRKGSCWARTCWAR